VLINQYAIVTAAHCFDWGDDFYEISVDYGTAFDDDPPMGNWCISNNSPDCNQEPADDNFFVYVHPDFTGGADSNDDIAVAVHWTWDPWDVIGDNEDYYIGLTKTAPGAGTSFAVHGYGRSVLTGGSNTGGLGRRGNGTEGISWTSSEYWLAYASQGLGHPCVGDSGSSAVNWTKTGPIYPRDLSMGVASNADIEDGENCPHIGEKFRYTKVNPKVGWINARLADAEAGDCGDVFNETFDWEYWTCF
jgi:hypothetical protein